MYKLFYKIFILLLVVTCGICAQASAQNIYVRSAIAREYIPIGDQTNLTFTVNQPVKVKVEFPKITDSIVSKVQVVSTSKLDTVTNQNHPGQITVSQTYVITGFDPGAYVIPQYAFTTPTGVLKTQELNFIVQPVKVDTTKAIFDIKQPLNVQYTFWEWLKANWILILSGIAVIGLVILLTWWLTTRKKEVPVVKKMIPVLPPHALAINKLNQLRDLKLWQQGEIKRYHSDLSDIIREYLEKRYGVKTHEKTTGEIFSELKTKEIAEEQRAQLSQVLILADLVKFAKARPSADENEQSMDDAVKFVTGTQPVAQPIVQKSEGGITGEPV